MADYRHFETGAHRTNSESSVAGPEETPSSPKFWARSYNDTTPSLWFQLPLQTCKCRLKRNFSIMFNLLKKMSLLLELMGTDSCNHSSASPMGYILNCLAHSHLQRARVISDISVKAVEDFALQTFCEGSFQLIHILAMVDSLIGAVHSSLWETQTVFFLSAVTAIFILKKLVLISFKVLCAVYFCILHWIVGWGGRGNLFWMHSIHPGRPEEKVVFDGLCLWRRLLF